MRWYGGSTLLMIKSKGLRLRSALWRRCAGKRSGARSTFRFRASDRIRDAPNLSRPSVVRASSLPKVADRGATVACYSRAIISLPFFRSSPAAYSLIWRLDMRRICFGIIVCLLAAGPRGGRKPEKKRILSTEARPRIAGHSESVELLGRRPQKLANDGGCNERAKRTAVAV